MTYSNGDYIEYLYDAVYKLTKEQKKESDGDSIYSQEFYYWGDGTIGDRTKLVTTGGLGNNTITYGFSALDQLTSKTESGTTTTYSYDADGNLTKADDGTNTWTYAYDWDDRLTSYDAPGSSNDATYGYDSLNWRRVKKSVDGVLTKYLPDVAAPGQDVLSEYDSSNNLLRSYVTPSIDENISLYDGTNTYYYMRDGLGSVRGLYNASQVLQNSYDYESFGQALSASENITQPYRFTGRAWDNNSSLYYYRTRYYGPSLGVFLQRDKAWAAAARGTDPVVLVRTYLPLQAYRAGDPVNRTDPFGLWTIEHFTSIFVAYGRLLEHLSGISLAVALSMADEIAEVAFADMFVDVNPLTSAAVGWLPDLYRKHHCGNIDASSPEEAMRTGLPELGGRSGMQMLNKAIADCNSGEVGTWLHFIQDCYTHYSATQGEHDKDKSLDHPGQDVYEKMISTTMGKLASFISHCWCELLFD